MQRRQLLSFFKSSPQNDKVDTLEEEAECQIYESKLSNYNDDKSEKLSIDENFNNLNA